MNNKDLINRFEIIFSENTALSDLRKLINDDDTHALYRLIEKLQPNQLITAIKSLHLKGVQYDQDCLSQGQLRSKLWLVNELQKLNLDLGTIFLCGGWYATLATLMFERDLNIQKIRSFDIDPSCVAIAETFNKPWVVDNWKFKAAIKDILDIDYATETYIVTRSDGTICELTDLPDTIVNTSCEHIERFAEWYDKIPSGKLVILQTNNYTEIEDHVNCSLSLRGFELITPMTTVLYSGELPLEKYTRYMRIGYK